MPSANTLYTIPIIPGNSGGRPSPHHAQRPVDPKPIVIALLLSLAAFLVFMWFFLSPLFLKKTPPTPLDVEDAYFVDENIKTRPPQSHGHNNKDMNRTIPSPAVASPPPAYTSQPNSPTPIEDTPSFSESSGGSQSRDLQSRRSFRDLLSGVHHLVTKSRSASASLPTSVFVPVPANLPLPSPAVLTQPVVNGRTRVSSEPQGNTALRPCVAPHSVSAITLHPPSIGLASPSQAVIHEISRSASESRFLSLKRVSEASGQHKSIEHSVSGPSATIVRPVAF